jgi:hypothetical protein
MIQYDFLNPLVIQLLHERRHRKAISSDRSQTHEIFGVRFEPVTISGIVVGLILQLINIIIHFLMIITVKIK